METRNHNRSAEHKVKGERAPGLNNPQGVNTTLKALQKLAPFITRGQWHTLWKLCQSGEEQAYFRQMVQDLTTRIEAMSQTYKQDGLGLRAVAHLHYFTPAFDFYITEKDRTGDGTQQAFGLACAHEREIGYISIRQPV
jgi:hypothetical protein